VPGAGIVPLGFLYLRSTRNGVEARRRRSLPPDSNRTNEGAHRLPGASSASTFLYLEILRIDHRNAGAHPWPTNETNLPSFTSMDPAIHTTLWRSSGPRTDSNGSSTP